MRMKSKVILAFFACAFALPTAARAAIGNWRAAEAGHSAELLIQLACGESTLEADESVGAQSRCDLEAEETDFTACAVIHATMPPSIRFLQADGVSFWALGGDVDSDLGRSGIGKCNIPDLQCALTTNGPRRGLASGNHYGEERLFLVPADPDYIAAQSQLWGVKSTEPAPEPTAWLVTGLLTLLLGFGAWIGERRWASDRPPSALVRQTATVERHPVARLILRHAGKFLRPHEAVAAAVSTGMPPQEAQAYLMSKSVTDNKRC